MKTLLLETSCLSDGTQWSLCLPGGGDMIADIADHLAPEAAEATANRIQDTLTACHGLDLPPDIAPGALAALVTAARDAEKMLSGLFREIDLPGEWERGTGESIDTLRAALAPFTADPAPPVSPQGEWEPITTESEITGEPVVIGWSHAPVPQEIQERLDYLRGEIEAERISYGEIAELQDFAPYINPDDTVLLEWAGVPEFPEDPAPFEMEVPDALAPVLRKHGAVKYKTHPSGLSAVFDSSDSLWHFYEWSPAAGSYACTGSSSTFE